MELIYLIQTLRVLTCHLKKIYFNIFENKAHLIRGVTQSPEAEATIKEDLFGKFFHVLITSAEVRGNDLAVYFIFFNTFAKPNLEKANFKNAKLWNANFYSANLTNADLSGADLRNALLGNADLSNANLEGTNLQDAILDNAILSNANLNCINHPICNS